MYPTRLDTYGCGCKHDCDYCYAKSQLEFRKLWNPHDPRVACLKKIEIAIKKLPRGKIVRLGGMTDCFQPREAKKRVTLETIKLLNEHEIGYLIVTKSPIVSYPYVQEVMNKDLAHIQITVTCLNDKISKKYEKAYSPEARIKAILKLQEQGFDTAIRLSPLLEEVMDFDKLNSYKIEKCIVEFLRINPWIQRWFPYADHKKYTLYKGNYYHLPLEEKTRIIEKVKLPNISVCEDVPEHYDFWQKNYNPNPTDCCNLRIDLKKDKKEGVIAS
jgi:DNA repair photolyase